MVMEKKMENLFIQETGKEVLELCLYGTREKKEFK